MKQLLLFFSLSMLMVASLHAQPFGDKNTNVQMRGGLIIDTLLLPPLYADTPSNVRLKVNGSLIRVVKSGDTGIYVYIQPSWRKLAQSSGGSVIPNLQQVTDAGATTTDSIMVAGIKMQMPKQLVSWYRFLNNLTAGKDSVYLMTAIAKPTIDGSNNVTWNLLGNSDSHDTLHVDSVRGFEKYLEFYFSPCSKVLTCITVPDDDFGAYGITMGAKGLLNSIQVYGSAPFGQYSGYFTLTGGNFQTTVSLTNLAFDSSNSAYSFKLTPPAGSNPNTSLTGLNFIANSQESSTRAMLEYAGDHGYSIKRPDDKFNGYFTVVDEGGNKVPNTAFTSTDVFLYHSGINRRTEMYWSFNINGFISANTNVWLLALVKK